MVKKRNATFHAPSNVVSLIQYRDRLNNPVDPPETSAPIADDVSIEALCCDHCGNGTFLLTMKNNIAKYDRTIVCSKCFEPSSPKTIDHLADILLGAAE